MKLSAAWEEILKMSNAKNLSPNQVFSILSDLGVFSETPKIRLATKVALNNGLFDMVLAQNVSDSEINALTVKIQYEGFSNDVIKHIIDSLKATAHNDSIKISSYQSIKDENSICQEKEETTEIRIFNAESTRFPSSDEGIFGIKIYFYPSLNKRNQILMQDLSCSNDGPRIFLHYDIVADSATINTGFNPINIIALVIDKNGFIHSKNRIAFINTNEKYAIRKGSRELTCYLSLTIVSKIIVYPESAKFQFDNVQLPRQEFTLMPYERFHFINANIIVEPYNKDLGDTDLTLKNIQLYGHDKYCVVCMDVLFIMGNCVRTMDFCIAYFNRENRLLDVSNFSIESSEFGILDCIKQQRPVNTKFFFRYYIIKAKFEDIIRVVISKRY